MFLHKEMSRYQCRFFPDKTTDTLLIVDDDTQSRTRLMQLCKHHFHIAFTAATSRDAERILRQNTVTHILCDYQPGNSVPDLVRGWRRQYPLIQRVILLSDSKTPTSRIHRAVDQVLEKGNHLARLLEALKS